MLRIGIALSIMFAVLLTAAGAASAEQQTGPTPLTPVRAKALIDTPSSGGMTALRPVTVQQVLQAASQPGAIVEGGPVRATTSSSAQSSSCWFKTNYQQWGTWPYQQRVNDNTYWCGSDNTGRLTWRVSTITTSTTLCSGDKTYTIKLMGGKGSKGVAVRAGAYFSCPTVIPWVTLHTSRWLDSVYGGRGESRNVEHS